MLKKIIMCAGGYLIVVETAKLAGKAAGKAMATAVAKELARVNQLAKEI